LTSTQPKKRLWQGLCNVIFFLLCVKKLDFLENEKTILQGVGLPLPAAGKICSYIDDEKTKFLLGDWPKKVIFFLSI
jgi:hypothetical protein